MPLHVRWPVALLRIHQGNSQMSEYQRCERCKEYGWIPCKCVRFRCGIPWKDAIDRESLDVVWARDAEGAATSYAEDRDRDGDYTIISNGEGEVWVLDEDNNQTKWSIEAYQEPVYRAHEKVTAPQRVSKP